MSDVPRLAWLSENHPPSAGGMAQSGDRIVSGLRTLGAQVDVFHFSARLNQWETHQQAGGRYFSCPLRQDPSHAMNRAWSMLRGSGRTYSHVIAFGGNLPVQAAPVYAAWLERPLITLLRGNDFDTAVFSPRRAPVLAEALRRSARVCCVSREAQRKVRALHPDIDVRWIPNGIATDHWCAQDFDRRQAHEWRLSAVPDGRLVLGLFGHLKPKKGLLFFLQSLLRSGVQERFHVLMVGDITEDATEWLLAQGEALSFTHLPFLDRYALIPQYSACDFVVLPSFYDGMPNTMLEAMALGIPLLAAATGGMADALEDGIHGLLFDPGDPHGCRHALSRAAASDTELRARWAHACRERCEQAFSAQDEAQAYRALMDETLARTSPIDQTEDLPS